MLGWLNMVKISRSVYVDSWYYEEAMRRRMNVSNICDDAIRRAVDSGDLSKDELAVFRSCFLPLNYHLDHKFVFPKDTHFDGISGKEFTVAKTCRMLHVQAGILDKSIFELLLLDVAAALPNFNTNEGIKIWASVRG